jgi:hypothetical protein
MHRHSNNIYSANLKLFLAIVKLFSTRRNPDTAQKQQIIESASSVADVLLKHLEPMEAGEYDRFLPPNEAKVQQRIPQIHCLSALATLHYSLL